MVATMLAPLTTRGRQATHIAQLDNAREVDRGMWDQVMVERFVEMVYRPGEIVARTAWIDAFEKGLDAAGSE